MFRIHVPFYPDLVLGILDAFPHVSLQEFARDLADCQIT